VPDPSRARAGLLPCLLAWGSCWAWACAADPAAGRPVTAAGHPAAIQAVSPAHPPTPEPPGADGAPPPAHDAVSPPDGGVAVADSGIAMADGGVATADPETAPEPPLIVPVPIEDPGRAALRTFHAALTRAAAGDGQARIAFFGASHVASDLFTDVIRRRLQARFGDAGPGFVPVAKPWRWHRHGRIEYMRSRALSGLRVKARAPKHERYGLAGVAMASGDKRGIARLRIRPTDDPAGTVDHLELYYLKQPGGGRMRVLIDGDGVKTIATGADAPTAAYERFEFEAGTPELELRTLADGPVRIFGVVAERSVPGVVLDTLGIPGSRARYHLHWEDTLYREHLARRRPDLVVLAYGTNESGDDDVPIAAYEKRLRKVLQRIKEVAPATSCLLVGPSDRPRRIEEDTYEPRPRTGLLVESQRRLSAEFGCGFFDLVGFMGGPMSMVRWVAADPRLGAPDHVHYTRRGYEALGERLHDALLEGYEPMAAEPAATSSSGTPRTP